MKHLIIEAPDRCGKDTLIKNLMPLCQNMVITHFSSPFGETDLEKRFFQEKSFRKEFEKSSFFLDSSMFTEPKKGKLDLIVWNRAHLGEFVYGNLYRQTNPEEWVMKIEEDFKYNTRDNVYLLLLVGDPDFLSSRDDGESFDGSVEARKKELANFRSAFDMSQIKKKLEIQVDEEYEFRGGGKGFGMGMIYDKIIEQRRKYKNQELILQEVLQFLNT